MEKKLNVLHHGLFCTKMKELRQKMGLLYKGEIIESYFKTGECYLLESENPNDLFHIVTSDEDEFTLDDSDINDFLMLEDLPLTGVQVVGEKRLNMPDFYNNLLNLLTAAQSEYGQAKLINIYDPKSFKIKKSMLITEDADFYEYNKFKPYHEILTKDYIKALKILGFENFTLINNNVVSFSKEVTASAISNAFTQTIKPFNKSLLNVFYKDLELFINSSFNKRTLFIRVPKNDKDISNAITFTNNFTQEYYNDLLQRVEIFSHK
ncbi:MAG: hypothetical protein JW791_03440 [Nanoarchaeota archaeon]|nr:hypothetical protein [Nanoarchaeota archaeon]